MGRFEDALAFAAKAHEGQHRKTSLLPFTLHPMEAATVVSSVTENEDVIIAALLHDTVEDAGVTFEEITEKFGARVSALVASETEDKQNQLPREATWFARKDASLRVLKSTSDRDVLILWLGDKLSNMRSFYRQYLAKGEGMWQHYHNHDPRAHKWYYTEIKKALSPLSDTAAYREYVSLVEKIFADTEDLTDGETV